MAAQVRLCYGATRHDPDANELYALNEALRDSPDEYPPDWWPDPARCRWWLGLHVDWKAYDEVAWQIRAISHSLGLEPGFESSEAARWHGYFEYLQNPNGRTNSAAQQIASRISLLKRLRVVPQDSVERLGGGYKRSGTYPELACPPTGLKRSGDGGKAVPISIQPCRAGDARKS